MLRTNQISRARYTAVIQHGDRVLAEAGLNKLTHAQRDDELRAKILAGEVAPWSEWRLVVNGKEYPPKYSSPEEMARAHKAKA